MILSSVELSEGSVQGPLLTLLGLFQAQCCEISLSFPSHGNHSSNVPAAKGASSCVMAALFSVSLSCINSHGKVSDFFFGMVVMHFLTLPITRKQRGHLLFSEVLQ